MSEPTRYRVADIQAQMTLGGGVLNGGILVVDPAGPIVAYGAYAKLQAENERLKAEVEAYRSASDEVAAAFLALPTPHNQVARVCEGIESLKAEVERLTKLCQATSPDGFIHIRDINAAKEGKPS